MSDTHYETLGTEPDAARDEIRAAYRERVDELDPERWTGDAEDRRTRAGAVNRAWNVLSDPFQKERYDDELAGGEVDLTDEESNDDSTAVEVAGSGGRARRPRGGTRVRPTQTPTGLPLAPFRKRVNALSVDVLAILVLLYGLNLLIGVMFAEPAVQVTIRDKVVRTTELDGRDVDSVAPAEEADARKEWAKDNDGTLKDKGVSVEKLDVLPQSVVLFGQLATLIVAIGYVTVPSLGSGQSVGKRFFKLRVVSADGANARPMQLVLHYGVPIALATALREFGALAAVGMTVWSNWDKAGQGANDKLAKTFVVEA